MGVKILVCDIDQFTYLDTLGYNSESKLKISVFIFMGKICKEIYNLIHLEIVAGITYDISLLNKSKNLRNMKEIYISGSYLDRLKYKEYITKRLPSVKVY